jgi:hemoglobin-like flavoprotein
LVAALPILTCTNTITVLVFLFRLFEESPDAQDLFYNFKDLKNQDELIQSLKELDHVARVMNAFGSCIELLDDMNQFCDTVQGLGKAHRKIGINGGHLAVSNLKLLLHSSFNPRQFTGISTAWYIIMILYVQCLHLHIGYLKFYWTM